MSRGLLLNIAGGAASFARAKGMPPCQTGSKGEYYLLPGWERVGIWPWGGGRTMEWSRGEGAKLITVRIEVPRTLAMWERPRVATGFSESLPRDVILAHYNPVTGLYFQRWSPGEDTAVGLGSATNINQKVYASDQRPRRLAVT